MQKQRQKQEISLSLSPQQIQFMNLLQIPLVALEKRIEDELESNPALEETSKNKEKNDETESSWESNINYNQSKEENYSSVTRERELSLQEFLLQQLPMQNLDNKEFVLAEFIIGCLDDNGFLNRSLLSVSDDLLFKLNLNINENDLTPILKVVQSLEPTGIGARNLKECLLLQLNRKRKNKYSILAKNIIENSFEEFSRKHYKKLQDRFSIDENDLKLVLNEISKLNPKPGGALSGSVQNTHVVPDFILKIEDGDLKVSLNKRNSPELRISNNYKEMLSGYIEDPNKTKSQKEAILFIKQKLDAAKWFIDAVEQRYQTLYLTINAIVEYQREYFLSGDEHKLKPMVLKDIAEKIKMDISTISRVANSKYIDTPYGLKLLKDFFSEGMKNIEGEDVSTIEIKKTLESIISDENKNKPLTDNLLSELLKEKGYNVARRTIAKYREQLGFPVARLRKKL